MAGSNGGDAPGAASLQRSLEAHTKGGMCVFAAHPNAPLLATATTSQVVKVWSAAGEPVGAMRAQPSSTAGKLGAVTCAAWHPYRTKLAVGAADSVCSVYSVDNASAAPHAHA